MTQHHDHGAAHGRDHVDKYRGLHKDWRAWTVVGVMLVAILSYVLTLDEEDVPSEAGNGQRVPAAAE